MDVHQEERRLWCVDFASNQQTEEMLPLCCAGLSLASSHLTKRTSFIKIHVSVFDLVLGCSEFE